MKNIYQTSLLSFGGILTGSYLLTPVLAPGPALLGGLVFSLGGILGFQFSQKQFVTKIDIHNQYKQIAVYSQA